MQKNIILYWGEEALGTQTRTSKCECGSGVNYTVSMKKTNKQKGIRLLNFSP